IWLSRRWLITRGHRLRDGMREDGLEQGRGQQLAARGLGLSLASHAAAAEADEIDLPRSHEYNLLAIMIGRAPERDLLGRLIELRGDQSPLGSAHIALGRAAAAADLGAVKREFFDLFVGLGRG